MSVPPSRCAAIGFKPEQYVGLPSTLVVPPKAFEGLARGAAVNYEHLGAGINCKCRSRHIGAD